MPQRYPFYQAWPAILFVLIIIITGCSQPETPANTPVQSETILTLPPPTATITTPPPSSTPLIATEPATLTPTVNEPEPVAPTVTSTSEPVREGVFYQDSFVDNQSGWVQSQDFDNYFIGYHEPEWYHVEVEVPNDFVPISLEGHTFADMTIETEVFVEDTLSAPEGDFRYGLILRRSGRQYYAFTISPRTNSWSILKSSPTILEELASGTVETNGLNLGKDTLRVDADGSKFTFRINGQRVTNIEDSEYSEGEVGFYVQNLDAERTHIHFDSLIVRQLEAEDILYRDNFEDTESGWGPTLVFGNYFIGYHEPHWYHVEIQEQNEDEVVAIPNLILDNFTVQLDSFVEEPLSAPEGDFQYGLALRRTGNLFYAFTISPRTGVWRVLKNSPTSKLVLDQGSLDTLQDSEADILRVDANSAYLTFFINDQPVSTLYDTDYSSGELGFYVETFDSPKVHIHFDTVTVREMTVPAPQCTVNIRLNLRTGPGQANQAIGFLPVGTELEPLNKSNFLPWIYVRVRNTGQEGWVYADEQFTTCNFSLSDLPSN